MIPIVARTTEELVRLVPDVAARGGARRWASRSGRSLLRVVLRTARAGIVTGVMLAVARVAGETAPLLFTAFGNRFWHQGLDQPIASLPVQIFTYAISPYDDWHRQAWAGALVLDRAWSFVRQPGGAAWSRGGRLTRGEVEHGRRHPASRDSTRGSATPTCCTGDRASRSPPSAVDGASSGRPGCGKSTFIRCLNRMHEVVPGARVAGQVLLDGEDIYAPGVDPVAAPPPGRHGLPEAESVPHHVDLRQRRGRAPA